MHSTKIQEQEELLLLEETKKSNKLIVWNDEVNTFEWVIETLIKVCNHSSIQAEQCTLIIHNNGKCDVKTGEFETLRPMCEAIIDRGINATIE